MATALATKWHTMLDLAKRMGPDQQLADIAELLAQKNPILDDMPWIEGNRPDGNIHTGRSSLATPTWRQINQGVAPTKSTTTQYTDVTGMLEMFTEVDVKLAEMSGNASKYQADEEIAQMEAMNQELAGTLFYGNVGTAPEEFTGFAPRYNEYGSSPRTTHVFNAGGSGSDNTSVFLVGWGPQTISGLYPKNSQMGLQRKPLGEQRVFDASYNHFMAFVTHYKWECGLQVKDWRYFARIANIDYSNVITAGDASDVSVNLIKLMLWALQLLPSRAGIRPVFYAHPDVVAMLAVKVMEKGNMALKIEDVTGPSGITREGTLTLFGVPVRGCDQIVLTETALTS